MAPPFLVSQLLQLERKGSISQRFGSFKPPLLVTAITTGAGWWGKGGLSAIKWKKERKVKEEISMFSLLGILLYTPQARTRGLFWSSLCDTVLTSVLSNLGDVGEGKW